MITGGGSGGTTTPAFAFGTEAARPAAGDANANTGYFATDTGEVTFSDGATWHTIGGFSGAVVFSYNATFQHQVSINDKLLTNALDIDLVGEGVSVKEGSNAKQGIATLAAGTVTVANTSVTTSSRIFLTCQTPGGTPGFLRISARTAGTGFTILSSSSSDTSTVAYEIFEPG